MRTYEVASLIRCLQLVAEQVTVNQVLVPFGELQHLRAIPLGPLLTQGGPTWFRRGPPPGPGGPPLGASLTQGGPHLAQGGPRLAQGGPRLPKGAPLGAR